MEQLLNVRSNDQSLARDNSITNMPRFQNGIAKKRKYSVVASAPKRHLHLIKSGRAEQVKACNLH